MMEELEYRAAGLDRAEPDLYMFWFTPDSDAAFAETIVAIATSIRNVE